MTVTIALSDDLTACLHVRRAVFIEEQGVSEAEEVDGRDGGALHLLAKDGGVPVGTARLMIDGQTGKIGRVAVVQSHRGRGLGAQIMRAAITALRARPGVTRAKLGAQIHALVFYEKLGFVAEGDEYLDAGIAHRDMVLTFSA